MAKFKIVARNQEELNKFGGSISCGFTMGTVVNPSEVVGVSSTGRAYNLEEAVDNYNSRYPFLEQPIQLIPISIK